MQIKFNHEIGYEEEEYKAMVSGFGAFFGKALDIVQTVVSTESHRVTAQAGHEFEMAKMRLQHEQQQATLQNELDRKIQEELNRHEMEMERLKEQNKGLREEFLKSSIPKP